jgi:cytoplasmic tRNA 2-thiolation protein 1
MIVRPKNHQKLCKACFIAVFEAEIHHTIVSNRLFTRGEKVAIGASGGKDSTVLASVLKTLNSRHDYGLDLVLLAIDEGIKGYRDDALKTVMRNAEQYDLPLRIVGYEELYGWTMDRVVEQVGRRGNCTYCGVFRRQALDRGAAMLGVQHVVTGHNADDMAETVMMNCTETHFCFFSRVQADANYIVLRGDLPRLSRATSIVTSMMPAAIPQISNTTKDELSSIKRSKPLKYAYEKEIVLYAHHKKLDYFSTECIYSPEAFRGTARALIKDLERIRPSAILDIVRSGEDMAKLCPGNEDKSCKGTCSNGTTQPVELQEDTEAAAGCGSSKSQGDDMRRIDQILARKEHHLELDVSSNNSTSADTSAKQLRQKKTRKGKKEPTKQTLGQCVQCGYMSSQSICKACMLLEGLNRNRPKTDISVAKRPLVGNEVDIQELEKTTSIQELNNHMTHLSIVPG